MDIFLLVMPSMLFVLLQYTITTYSKGVKSIESIKEYMEKYLEKNIDYEKTLQDNELQSNIDFILVSANNPERESTRPWLIFSFAPYLVLIALFHTLGVYELYNNDMLESNNSQGNGHMITPILMYFHGVCLVYMLILVCITLGEISPLFPKVWAIKKVSKLYREVKLYHEVKLYREIIS